MVSLKRYQRYHNYSSAAVMTPEFIIVAKALLLIYIIYINFTYNFH